MIEVFRRVNEQRLRDEREHPFDPKNPMKPNWCYEGDIFVGVWEGANYFSIGRVHRRNGRVIVDAHLELVIGGRAEWTDHLILDVAGDEWVVSDIEYADGGTLVTGIARQLA